MVRRAMPKRVTLPNGRTFVARYERASRDALLPNIRIKRRYRGRPARGTNRQGGRRILSVIKKVLLIGKKIEKKNHNQQRS